jgi:glycosyltransferase involved in cell wall biosynthesis
MVPSVSVVTRVYNAERHLREAIDCMLAQSYGDFELLAIDDGSTDTSPEILHSYADPRLRVIRQCNGGKNAAAIRGLSEARGTYVAILDADDRSAPDRLALQVAFLERNPDVVMLGSAVNVIDERGRRVATRHYPRSDGELRAAAPVYNPFAHSSIMFRSDCALAAGGYSANLILEDFDLNMRLMQCGKVANLPQVLSEYRIRTDSVDAKLIKLVLRGTIVARALAHRVYGFPRTLRGALVDVAQRMLSAAPGALVNWITVKALYRA